MIAASDGDLAYCPSEWRQDVLWSHTVAGSTDIKDCPQDRHSGGMFYPNYGKVFRVILRTDVTFFSCALINCRFNHVLCNQVTHRGPATVVSVEECGEYQTSQGA